MPPRTILLATDLSARSDRALDRSIQLASQWNAKLVVVHAYQALPGSSDIPSWRRSADPKQEARARIIADTRGMDSVDMEVVVENGEPVPVILDLADKYSAELIVTAVARDETLGRMLLGSTVEKLVRTATIPVLVVKSRPSGAYNNVVVATDYSDGSRAALEEVIRMLPESQLSLFHAFEVAFEGIIENRSAARDAATRAALAESHSFLDSIPAVEKSGKHIPVVCEYGDITSLLQKLIFTKSVDLVGLGTHGRGAIASFLLGSVAQRLVSELAADVLLVRRRKEN